MYESEYGAYRILTASDVASIYEPDELDPDWPDRRRELLVYAFTKRRLVRELIDAWEMATGLSGRVILEAHGNQIGGQWIYDGGDNIFRSVQGWIDEWDGKVAALMILTCNPNKTEISAQHSLVLHQRRLVDSFPAEVLTQGLMRVYVPRMGYIERDYRMLRRTIDSLAKVNNL
jgi:hypothetical protein